MAVGFVKLHREITDWEWYRETNTKSLFIHLLLNAVYQDVRYKGRVVPRGSLVTTVVKLSRELDLSAQKIRTALKNLKSTNDIAVKTTNRESTIEVLNYNLYQGEYFISNNPITDRSQSTNDRTEEEVKNINNSLLSKNTSTRKADYQTDKSTHICTIIYRTPETYPKWE